MTELPDWLQHWPVWAVLLLAIGLPAFRTLSELVKWLGNLIVGREDARARSQELAAQQFEVARTALLAQLQVDLDKARRTMDGYEAELAKLRRIRSNLMDTMLDIRTAALTARAMVHDLERRLGDTATVFRPLPSLDEETPHVG